MTDKIAIYGVGGLAREIYWLLERANQSNQVIGYIQDDKQQVEYRGLPVFELDELAKAHPDTKVVIAIGSPQTRKILAKKCDAAGLSFIAAIDPKVDMSSSVSVPDSAVICCGSILTVDIDLGEHVQINLDCTVGHDVRMGAFATLAPGVHVSGNVHIGEGVYIGTGACIINGNEDIPLVIGEGAVIGAGACVTKPVEPFTLHAGVPATLKKSYK